MQREEQKRGSLPSYDEMESDLDGEEATAVADI